VDGFLSKSSTLLVMVGYYAKERCLPRSDLLLRDGLDYLRTIDLLDPLKSYHTLW